MDLLEKILVEKTGIKREYIRNIIKLMDEGATIPFIARYRKEMTGSASDEDLRIFETVYESTQKLLIRKDEVSRLISERGVLSDHLRNMLDAAKTLREVEEIYRPFKEKKSSRATTAITNGLKPLANTLQRAELSVDSFKKEARHFVKGAVKSVDEAIKGAQDILAERYADQPREREVLRSQMMRFGTLTIKKAKGLDEKGIYGHFVGQSERVTSIPSHRYLAVMRGVKEKALSVKITVDVERTVSNIKEYKIPAKAGSVKGLLLDAYKDGLKRLLLPSIEREVFAELKERSDLAAINVFGKNLQQLLMTPPVVKRVILGVDPAFRSGCKLAVIDENGHYLEHHVIYPTAPVSDYEASKKKVLALTKKYKINAVAIGNGTASRETQEFFAQLNRESDTRLQYTVVSEAGASVYSASKIAAQEYPELDVTIRGAISIAQRLRDPMAALVKIDPKSLGIGQYQHDVDQRLLEKKLTDVTQDLVNHIGVDLNSASATLLSYVAGIGLRVAENIVKYREKEGAFRAKSELLKVKGLGAKAYEQAAGFVRIKEGVSTLDNSGVHPESYGVAEAVLRQGLSLDIAVFSKQNSVGVETLRDIVKELEKPGFDPREELPKIPFKEDITDIKMLKEGSFVSGVVRNIADFGAFVDIGLKNDGMIHISKMSEHRIKHPLEVLSINQYLPNIEVISVDLEKGKVGLSLRV